jgi:hypothetical protein
MPGGKGGSAHDHAQNNNHSNQLNPNNEHYQGHPVAATMEHMPDTFKHHAA